MRKPNLSTAVATKAMTPTPIPQTTKIGPSNGRSTSLEAYQTGETGKYNSMHFIHELGTSAVFATMPKEYLIKSVACTMA